MTTSDNKDKNTYDDHNYDYDYDDDYDDDRRLIRLII